MADERLDYAVLISLYMREEAEVMACTLRADGIDAFIGNSNHAWNNWFYTIALGGLQVMVPRARIAEAKEALRERVRWSKEVSVGDDAEPRVGRRDRWKLWLIIALYVFLWTFPLFDPWR